jgi:hypothetical protein
MEIVYGRTVEGIGHAVELFQKRRGPLSPAVALASMIAESGMGDKTTADWIARKPVDISWLPYASSKYKISHKIEDFVVTAVPFITSDIPNRNMQSFPTEEIFDFKPRFGRVAYRTFVGKPTFQNHKNEDFFQAKGVNFDSIVTKVPRYNLHKIIVLSAFDRSKDSALAEAILKKERRFYSMGSWVEFFECSVCGANLSDRDCSCFSKYGKGGVTKDGKLVYQNCRGCDWFEGSSVDDPADWTAVSDEILSML